MPRTRKNFKKLRDELAEKVGEERLAEDARAEAEAYDAAQRRLPDVRRARALTQVQLAEALGVSQAQVSRIEKQADLYLSTLASYIEAMGGELELHAVFPDSGERVWLSIGDIVGTGRAGAEARPAKVPDLMTALEASLASLRGAEAEGASGEVSDPPQPVHTER